MLRCAGSVEPFRSEVLRGTASRGDGDFNVLLAYADAYTSLCDRACADDSAAVFCDYTEGFVAVGEMGKRSQRPQSVSLGASANAHNMINLLTAIQHKNMDVVDWLQPREFESICEVFGIEGLNAINLAIAAKLTEHASAVKVTGEMPENAAVHMLLFVKLWNDCSGGLCIALLCCACTPGCAEEARRCYLTTPSADDIVGELQFPRAASGLA